MCSRSRAAKLSTPLGQGNTVTPKLLNTQALGQAASPFAIQESRAREAVVFTATQPSGVAGLSLPLGHKKRGRALGPA
ncbi:MAG: hypothetical protein OXS32_12235, partial [Verrucomicrobiales bacterium]|nr:hypothetical protein [Verrucomicrobiales bacterium]